MSSSSFARTSTRAGRLAGFALLALLLVLPTRAFADSGDSDRWKSRGNLIQVLEADGRFGTLLTALGIAELTDVVANADALTVFAPTDAAFEAVPSDVLEALLADKEALTKVLLYHVLGGDISSTVLGFWTVAYTEQGQPIAAIRDGRGLRINGNPVVNANVRASNGRAHVIESVLLPADEDFKVESLVDVLALDGRFTTLIDLVIKADLADAAINGGPFTLFAPTNDAFAALGEDTLNTVAGDPELLRSILEYHIAEGRRSALWLLITGGTDTLLGQSVEVGIKDGGIFVNDSRVIGRSAWSPNATIHVIDAVLLPDTEPPSLLDALSEAGYTTLVAAIEAAGIGDTLAGLGPITILAPSNEAFAALGDDTLNALLNDPETLGDILSYHVIVGQKRLIELIVERDTETVQGASVRTKWRFFRGIRINDARVIEGDLHLPGATVQGINKVLIPPTH